jgi:CheY-like chemotaxis protein
MRGDPRLQHIPVAVLTTSKTEADVLRSYELGANCFITKPVGFAELIQVIHGIEEFWLTVVSLPKKHPV